MVSQTITVVKAYFIHPSENAFPIGVTEISDITLHFVTFSRKVSETLTFMKDTICYAMETFEAPEARRSRWFSLPRKSRRKKILKTPEKIFLKGKTCLSGFKTSSMATFNQSNLRKKCLEIF